MTHKRKLCVSPALTFMKNTQINILREIFTIAVAVGETFSLIMLCFVVTAMIEWLFLTGFVSS